MYHLLDWHKLMKSNVSHKQIAGMVLSPDWVAKPSLAEPYIQTMADHGYAVVNLLVRHMHLTHRDPPVHDTVNALCAAIQRRGMKCILDMDHLFWGTTVTELCPETALGIIGCCEAMVHEGRFDVSIAYPPVGLAHGQLNFHRLVAAWRADDKGFKPMPLSLIAFDWQNTARPRPGVQLKGTLKGAFSGRLVLYVVYRHYGLVDVAHPRYLQAQKELLDQYADIPLDGFGWDEPGKGMGHPGFFKSGAGFQALFRRRNGYDLEKNLIWLDHADESPLAVKTRCDYYTTLNDMNFRAQAAFNRHARRVFGKQKELIFGTHHTWSGLPMDLAGGVIDYFRLGRLLTAAWTDGSWDVDTKYPAFNFLLADGIRKELGLRDAYYNDWTNCLPAAENMRFATRYKMLFHVNWFNIFFSNESEGIVNYRLEPLKSAAKADAVALDRFDQLLENRFQAYSPVAWLYLWEGVAAAPKWLVRAWYTAMANTALHLTDRGLYATLMSSDSIREGGAKGKRFLVNGADYQAVIVPYAHAIPEDIYRKLLDLTKAGVPVIFFGPPPQFTTLGIPIGGDFARRTGIKPFRFSDYQSAYANCHPLPGMAEWEPETIDFSYPMVLTDGKVARDSEGNVAWVKASNWPLYYLSQPDPREELCNLLETLISPIMEAYAERTYCRLFTDPCDTMHKVLLAVAKGRIAEAQVIPTRLGWGVRTPRKHSELKALVRVDGMEIRLHGGTWCAIKLGPKGIEAVEGDCPNVALEKTAP